MCSTRAHDSQEICKHCNLRVTNLNFSQNNGKAGIVDILDSDLYSHDVTCIIFALHCSQNLLRSRALPHYCESLPSHVSGVFILIIVKTVCTNYVQQTS